MTVSKFLFGTGFENEIRVGFPLYDIITDREDGEGSEYIDMPDGSIDPWRQNKMFTMQAEARWIPDGPGTSPVQTQLSGPVSWEEFIDWARDGRAFRLLPDENLPDFYVDNTYLVEPRKGFGSLSPDIKRNVQLKLRNPAKSFHEAMRGIMFEYAPGTSLTDPVAAAFTRATLATRRGVGSFPVLGTDGANVLRDRHYINGIRTTLIEPARTQGWTNSRALDTGWILQNATIVANASVGPDGLSPTVDHLTESTDGAPVTHYIGKALPAITDNTNQSVTWCLRAGTRSWCLLEGQNKANVFYNASCNLAAGTVGTVTGGATGRISGPFSSPFVSDPFYIVTMTFPSASGGTTPASRLYPATGDGAAAATYQGNGGQSLSIFQGQFEADTNFGSSLIDPGSAVRNADNLDFPFTYVPQAMFMLCDWIDQGIATGADGNAFVVQIGNQFQDGRFIIDSGTVDLTCYHQANSGSVQSGTTPPASYGDRLQVLAVLRPDGSVQLKRTINLGAEAAAGQSGALAFRPGSWNTARINFYGGTMLGQALVRCKVGSLTLGSVTRDTIAKALAA